MARQWHRVEDGSTPQGHALTASIRSCVWKTYQQADGRWKLSSDEGHHFVVDSLADARALAERGGKQTNPSPFDVVVSSLSSILVPVAAMTGMPRARNPAYSFDDYVDTVDRALAACFAKEPPAQDVSAYMQDPRRVEDVFVTLSSVPEGIWDGRWIELYPRDKERQWMRIENCLRLHVGDEQAIAEAMVFEVGMLHRKLRR